MNSKPGKLFIWQWGRFGAGPRLAYELAWAMRNYTDQSVLLSLSNQAELVASLRDPSDVDFPINSYSGAKEAALKSLRLPLLLNDLQRFIERERPLAAISVMAGYWDVFAARRLVKLGIPVITLVHDASPHPGDRLAPIVALHRRQITSSSGIITLSDYVASQLRQLQLIAADQQHCTIPHPGLAFPDLSLAGALASDYDGTRPLRLLLPGRLKRYKGAHLLVEALQQIDPALVQARIAGVADDASWIATARQLPNCELDLRWLPEAELVAEIDRADVLIAPYIEASQSGVIPIALGRGRPAVATPVGGLTEQVNDGVTGLVTSDVSAAALAHSIETLARNPDIYQRLAAAAARKAKEAYSWSTVAQRYVSAARDAAAGTAGA